MIDMDYPFAKNAYTGYYTTYHSDTLAANGQFILVKNNNKAYLLSSDYSNLNLNFGDSISNFIFDRTYFNH